MYLISTTVKMYCTEYSIMNMNPRSIYKSFIYIYIYIIYNESSYMINPYNVLVYEYSY